MAGLRRNQPSVRGFVLVIVLLIMAVLAITVAVQSDVAVADRVAASKVRSEARARAIAESCLSEEVQSAREKVNSADLEDFDSLLDPGGFASPGVWDATMFLPDDGSSRRTILPSSAATGAGTEQEALHQYRVRPASGGACLVRYDDNQDDNLPDLGLSVDENGIDEGNGTEVHNRDRDRSIIVTAIGIYPFADDPANDATAYERASARVTVKALLQTEIVAETGGELGLWVGGNVTHAGAAKALSVCGAVGGTSVVGSIGGGDTDERCTCGDDISSSGGMSTECGTSDCAVPGWAMLPSAAACAPIAPAGGPAAPPDPAAPAGIPVIPAPGAPTFDVTKMKDGSLTSDVCEYYFDSSRADAHVWLFDHEDTTAHTVGVLPVVYTTLLPVPDPRILGGEDCSDPASVVGWKEPCTWTDLVAGVTAVTCTLEQSACWKPVVVLGGGGDQAFGGGVESTGSGEIVLPVPGRVIPYGEGRTYEDLCGDVVAIGTDNDDGWLFSSPKWELADNLEHDDWHDRGTYWLFDEGAGGSVELGKQLENFLGGDFPVAIFSTSPVRMTQRVAARCPTCAQDTCNGAAPPPEDVFLYAPSAPCTIEKVQSINGHITCRVVEVKKGDAGPKCINGDLVATEMCNDDGTCSSGAAWNAFGDWCWDSSQCQKRPGICIEEDLQVNGDLVTPGEIQIKKKVRITGNVVAATADGARICVEGGSSGGSGSGSGSGSGGGGGADAVQIELPVAGGPPNGVIWAAANPSDRNEVGIYSKSEQNRFRATDVATRGRLIVEEKKTQFEGKVHVGSAVFSQPDVLVFGSLHVVEDFTASGQKTRIINDGTGEISTEVKQSILWLEQTW